MMRPDITRVQVKALVDHLRDALGDEATDQQTLLDNLEGETDLFEMAARILSWIENDETTVFALNEQISARKDRQARAEARIARYRETLQALMETGGIDKLPLPEATVTLRKVAPKPIVTDVDALPDGLCKITRKPDMAAIKAAVFDEPLPGVAFDNGGVSLTIRRR